MVLSILGEGRVAYLHQNDLESGLVGTRLMTDDVLLHYDVIYFLA